MQSKLQGYIMVVISSLAFGTLGLWAKWGYAFGFTPLSLLVVRFGVASLCLWLAVVAKHRDLAWPGIKPALALALQGGLGYALTAGCFFLSLQHLPAGLASMLFYLHPVITSSLTPVLFAEQPEKEQKLSLGAAVLGSILLAGGALTGNVSWIGVMFALFAAVAYSGFTLAGQMTSKSASPLVATTYTSTACFLALTLWTRPSMAWLATLTPQMWLIGLGVALVATVLAILLYLAGIQQIGASRTAVISALEPATGVLLSVLLLGEMLSIGQIMGIICILGAVLLLTGKPLWRRIPAKEQA